MLTTRLLRAVRDKFEVYVRGAQVESAISESTKTSLAPLNPCTRVRRAHQVAAGQTKHCKSPADLPGGKMSLNTSRQHMRKRITVTHNEHFRMYTHHGGSTAARTQATRSDRKKVDRSRRGAILTETKETRCTFATNGSHSSEHAAQRTRPSRRCQACWHVVQENRPTKQPQKKETPQPCARNLFIEPHAKHCTSHPVSRPAITPQTHFGLSQQVALRCVQSA